MAENPDCHYGDHDYLRNGRCKWCDDFNGGMLQLASVERAVALGLVHGDHYHRTAAALAVCERPILPDLPCEACQHPASVHEEDGCYRCLTEGGPCE